jgi:hypothetical protein
MDPVHSEVWILLAALGIPIIGIILPAVVRLAARIRINRSGPGQAPAEKLTDRRFDDEMLQQLIEQQVEAAVAAIKETARQEQAKLMQMIAPSSEAVPLVDDGQFSTSLNRTHQSNGSQQAAAENHAHGSKYSMIATMAEGGLDASQIASVLNLPKSEIALYIKLRLARDPEKIDPALMKIVV